MGGAMLRGWLDQSITNHVCIIDPSDLPPELISDSRITHIKSYENQEISTDIVVLAVKPQILKAAVTPIASNIQNDTVILSIAAGQTIANFEDIFGQDTPIVRCMPNTPAAIGKGMSVCVANKYVSDTQKNAVNAVMNVSGLTKWVEDEALMDAVTALSGSGPAYIFYLIEALAAAGAELGLDPDIAMTLARQTVVGSAALAETDATIPASTLRKNVTSPGGTTEAALNVMMDGRYQELINEALKAAANRSIELKG